MKKVIKIFFFYFIIAICWIFQESFVSDYSMNKGIIITEEEQIIGIKTEDYDIVIEYIKSHEGFVDTIYTCPAGVRTIGYGHVLLSSDKFKIPISKAYGEKLLQKDFDKAFHYARKLTNLKGKKLLAISHFIYCFGSAKFERSTLYKHIKENKPINQQIIKWTKINGVHSKYLLEQRLFELNLFNE